MSIAGRNRVRGSTVQVYRVQKLEGSGGQQSRTPAKLHADQKIELLPLTDEVALKVYGESEHVELQAMVETWRGVQKGDRFAVTAGPYSDPPESTNRSYGLFVVVAARPLGNWTELGLAAAQEPLGLPTGEAP